MPANFIDRGRALSGLVAAATRHRRKQNQENVARRPAGGRWWGSEPVDASQSRPSPSYGDANRESRRPTPRTRSAPARDGLTTCHGVECATKFTSSGRQQLGFASRLDHEVGAVAGGPAAARTWRAGVRVLVDSSPTRRRLLGHGTLASRPRRSAPQAGLGGARRLTRGGGSLANGPRRSTARTTAAGRPGASLRANLASGLLRRRDQSDRLSRRMRACCAWCRSWPALSALPFFSATARRPASPRSPWPAARSLAWTSL